jgi:hypothetical protein
MFEQIFATVRTLVDAARANGAHSPTARPTRGLEA